jgi:hypothetical protein
MFSKYIFTVGLFCLQYLLYLWSDSWFLNKLLQINYKGKFKKCFFLYCTVHAVYTYFTVSTEKDNIHFASKTVRNPHRGLNSAAVQGKKVKGFLLWWNVNLKIVALKRTIGKIFNMSVAQM